MGSRFSEQPCKVYLDQSVFKLKAVALNYLSVFTQIVSCGWGGTNVQSESVSIPGNAGGSWCRLVVNCHVWKSVFYKRVQRGAVNLGRVMHLTDVEGSYERERGKGEEEESARVNGWEGGGRAVSGGIDGQPGGDRKSRATTQNSCVYRQSDVKCERHWEDVLRATHHESKVVKAIEQELALVLRQPHVLQPLSHRLVQGFTTGPICREREALQQWKAVQPVAAALRGRHMALPHHPRPAEAEPSAAAPGSVGGRQGPGREWGAPTVQVGARAKLKHRRRIGSAAGPAQTLQGTE